MCERREVEGYTRRPVGRLLCPYLLLPPPSCLLSCEPLAISPLGLVLPMAPKSSSTIRATRQLYRMITFGSVQFMLPFWGNALRSVQLMLPFGGQGQLMMLIRVPNRCTHCTLLSWAGDKVPDSESDNGNHSEGNADANTSFRARAETS